MGESMRPLMEPVPWPPPARPEGDGRRKGWRGWWAERWELARRRREWRRTSGEIERQLEGQLKGRTGPWAAWPVETMEVRAVEALAKAIESERNIESLFVHPDDRVPLLFFATGDDWSWQQFVANLDAAFGVRLTRRLARWVRPLDEGFETWDDYYRSSMTVRELVGRFLEAIRAERGEA